MHDGGRVEVRFALLEAFPIPCMTGFLPNLGFQVLVESVQYLVGVVPFEVGYLAQHASGGIIAQAVSIRLRGDPCSRLQWCPFRVDECGNAG